MEWVSRGWKGLRLRLGLGLGLVGLGHIELVSAGFTDWSKEVGWSKLCAFCLDLGFLVVELYGVALSWTCLCWVNLDLGI